MTDLFSKRNLIALVSLLLVAGPTAAFAGDAGRRCDQLAAHPADPTRDAAIVGVATGEIDVEAAIAACRAAIAAVSAEPRFHYQLGRAFFDSRDYDGAFREFTIAADGQLAIGKAALGYLYEQGLGTPADPARGLQLTLQAANADIGFAAHNLGVTYRDGTSVPHDYAQSLVYFRKAASLGYSQSLVDIGFAYDKGYGVDVDYAEALRWYRAAAEQAVPEAFNNLGDLYEKGQGVTRDYRQALSWYRKAEAQGFTLAYVNIAHLADAGLGLPNDPAAAAALVMKAFEEGGADEDAFNRDYLNEETWTPDFWTAFRTLLAAGGHLKVAPETASAEETTSAVNAMLDR